MKATEQYYTFCGAVCYAVQGSYSVPIQMKFIEQYSSCGVVCCVLQVVITFRSVDEIPK